MPLNVTVPEEETWNLDVENTNSAQPPLEESQGSSSHEQPLTIDTQEPFSCEKTPQEDSDGFKEFTEVEQAAVMVSTIVWKQSSKGHTKRAVKAPKTFSP